MLKAIKRLLSVSKGAPDGSDLAASNRDVRLAACVLLIELANADDEFTADERKHVHAAVRRQFGLDADEAEKLLEEARAEREQAVDLWEFTNLVAENYSTAQKMVLAEVMWGLVYSDGDLAKKEDYLMRRICGLLRLEPGYLADARKRISDDDEARG